MLYEAELSEPLIWRWRHRGTTPRPDEFPNYLWNGVNAQFMVCRRSTDEPVGLVTSYNHNPRNGYTWLAALRFDPTVQSIAVTEGAGLFMNYLFQVFGYRKIYLEVVEFNLSQMEHGLHRFFVEEGRFVEHEFYDGRWWDVVHLAAWRDAWQAHGGKIIDRLSEH
jgi:RimJ/RimL family protein N-acetyltransferase